MDKVFVLIRQPAFPDETARVEGVFDAPPLEFVPPRDHGGRDPYEHKWSGDAENGYYCLWCSWQIEPVPLHVRTTAFLR